ncbi:MAG TPA: VWA domain-containing protein [Nocardioidaceae bacterium]|nr:VWA domain-containing protein [Nocardioidaceae bacterium]
MSDPDEILLGFARALRAAGLRVTADRSQTMLQAVSVVGLGDERATYWAARAAVCAGPDDLVVFDRVFDEWFHGEGAGPAARRRPVVTVVQASLDGDGSGDGEGDASTVRTAASDIEVLRHRDIAELSAADRARLAALFDGLHPRLPRRTAYRHRPWRRGTVDRRATLRQMRRSLGEPVDIAWQHRSTRSRRVVLLVDVSGSMSPYADALLRLAHRVSRGTQAVETFTLGTRLTRVTRAMRLRDADAAVVASGEAVPDWSGGTRLGETLKAFLDRWGQRGLARGAVVVVFSDGWERGDASLLATQMQRLRRLAHRVVWVNPHKGADGYRPVQVGMAAALPFCDDFVAGHSFAAFDELVGRIARA